MSEPSPESSQDGKQMKDTHPVPGQKLKTKSALLTKSYSNYLLIFHLEMQISNSSESLPMGFVIFKLFMENVDARFHIYTVTALRRARVTSPLGRLYPRGKLPVLILQEAEWTQDPSVHEGVKTNLHSSDTWGFCAWGF